MRTLLRVPSTSVPVANECSHPTKRFGILGPVSIGPGTRLGKYELLRQLGSGAMGVVYEAKHLTLGNHVAIKVLQQLASNGEAGVRRFEQEARIVARLESRHIVRVLDADQAGDGTRYLVMELMRGRDLSAIVNERRTLPTEEVVDIALQVCAGLKHAHEAGIVHRDLKPANLFVAESDEGSTVKIMDFGISKDLASISHELTASSVMIGTPNYMSPEQIRTSRSVDERSDLWSLGVIMYRLLAGCHPFTGDNHGALLVAISTERPLDVRSYAQQVPEGLARIVMCLLEKLPEKRPDSAAALGRLLLPFAPPFREYPTFETASPDTVRSPSLLPDTKTSGTTQVASTVPAPEVAMTAVPDTAPATTKPTRAQRPATMDHPATIEREPPVSRSSEEVTVDTGGGKAVATVLQPQASAKRNRAFLMGGASIMLVLGLGATWWSQRPKHFESDHGDSVSPPVLADAAPRGAGADVTVPLANSSPFPPPEAPSASAKATATATIRVPARPPIAAANTARPSTSGAPSALPSAPTHIR